LGAEILLAGRENGKNYLFKLDVTGSCRGYFGVTCGKGQQVAKSWIEKIDRTKTINEALSNISKALVSAHEEFKEKTWVLEIGSVGIFSNEEWNKLDLEESNRLVA